IPWRKIRVCVYPFRHQSERFNCAFPIKCCTSGKAARMDEPAGYRDGREPHAFSEGYLACEKAVAERAGLEDETSFCQRRAGPEHGRSGMNEVVGTREQFCDLFGRDRPCFA